MHYAIILILLLCHNGIMAFHVLEVNVHPWAAYCLHSLRQRICSDVLLLLRPGKPMLVTVAIIKESQ